MSGDLERLLAALNGATAADADAVTALPGHTKRKPGRPPALTPAQVESLRQRRRLPLDRRPRLAELAAEFRVDVVTIGLAVLAKPPYDFGEPAPHVGGRHRDRGSQRFPPTE